MPRLALTAICLAAFLAVALPVRAARVEDLADGAARDPVSFLPAPEEDAPSPFVFSPGPRIGPADLLPPPPTVAPPPAFSFVPDVPLGGEHAGWALVTVPRVASAALADLTLAGSSESDYVPEPETPPMVSVPEPAAVLLFLAGAALLAAAGARRKRVHPR